MKTLRGLILSLVGVSILFSCRPEEEKGADNVQLTNPLPSWNEGKTKASIIEFIEKSTDKNSPTFVPEEDRIACFDNDGTLWSEKPFYFQLFYIIDRVKATADQHPEWKNTQPYKAILENDLAQLKKTDVHQLLELVQNTLAGSTPAEYKEMVKAWMATAQHPTKHKRFDQLVYQPMLELLDYLRANGYKTYIVSGGGVDFMRATLTNVYGIPSEQIIGSSLKTKFNSENGNYSITRLPKIGFIDDKDGKPLNINTIIGKKPTFCAGNSDGDLPMMQWTSSQGDKAFMLYVHHTDVKREWAYDRNSSVGRLNKGLDQALKDGWTIADMKDDWKVIYPFELKK
ncbi:haloacid dehalogenase (plasmid) [Fulvitalea axinellae]|uniref:Haloacid dehalogenase n=1 Tax=Fulvitalea axinellae TaxID=1182444 RepID=A0AAU9CMY4_9BACT|nr:haloacid dehalogenase [Fulvitalea axinellae]